MRSDRLGVFDRSTIFKVSSNAGGAEGVAARRRGESRILSPPFDHPHIFIDMGSDSEAICSYCSTRFVYDPELNGACSPAECELRDVA